MSRVIYSSELSSQTDFQFSLILYSTYSRKLIRCAPDLTIQDTIEKNGLLPWKKT